MALILGMAWMAGGFIGKAMIHKPFFPKIRKSNAIQFVFVAAMLLTAPLASNIFTLVSFAFLIHVCSGFIFNNYFAYCLGRFPEMAGLSGGFIGGLVYVLCSFFSYGLTYSINPENQYQLSFAYLILATLILVFLYLTRRYYKKRSASFKKL